ncbi:MAG: hypothetical protein IKH57_19555 [Clostridia bacterium]|nr:hypothetical protein [Clostridia bacterium]
MNAAMLRLPSFRLASTKKTLRIFQPFKLQIGKDEKRAKGRRGILFSPKENQKGRYNGGDHRIASGPAAESGQPGCDASGESRGIIPREKLAFF